VPELKNKHGLTLRCYLPLVTLAISYNGSIPYCFFKNNHRYRYNYFELNSLKEFIRSREYAGWMDNFTNSNLPEFCADCNFCSFYEFESIKERFEYFKRAG
jgi:radical SAM protein with 4Fe4S-binding SPASM domain